MKSIIIGLLFVLIFLVYKDLTFKIRYRDNPDTKKEWWQKGYDVGVDSCRDQEFMEMLAKKYLKNDD